MANRQHNVIEIDLFLFSRIYKLTEVCCKPEDGGICALIFSELDRLSLRVKDIFRSASPADGGRLDWPGDADAVVSAPLLATRGKDGTLLRRAVD